MNNQEVTIEKIVLANLMKETAKREHCMKSEIVKKGMLARVEAGYSLQRPPVGYSETGQKGLYKVNRHGKALRELMLQLLESSLSVPEFNFYILLILYVNPQKGLMRTNIAKLPANPYYAGMVSHRGKLYQGLHEPLITPDEQQKMIEILKA